MWLWLGLPVLGLGGDAQDAVPFVVAGSLARDDPGSIYSQTAAPSVDADPAFTRRACEIGFRNCEAATVSYVATPLVLPLTLRLSSLEMGGFGLRLVGSACLVAGMVVLRRRVRNDPVIAFTALTLTPLAIATIHLAQTSPVLFVSVALGANASRWLIATTWITSGALKIFPWFLGGVLTAERRWRTLAYAGIVLAGLTALTIMTVGPAVFDDFARSTIHFAREAERNPYNAAVNLGALRPALAGLIIVLTAKIPAGDRRWAFVYSAALLVIPVLWFHYLWVTVAAVALTARRTWILPAVAAATILPAVSHLVSTPMPRTIYLVALAGTAAVSWQSTTKQDGPVIDLSQNGAVIDLTQEVIDLPRAETEVGVRGDPR